MLKQVFSDFYFQWLCISRVYILCCVIYYVALYGHMYIYTLEIDQTWSLVLFLAVESFQAETGKIYT